MQTELMPSKIELNWERDSSRDQQALGYETLRQECAADCIFTVEDGDPVKLDVKPDTPIAFASIEDLKWSSLTVSGVLDVPTKTEFDEAAIDSSALVCVVACTTRGASRFRSFFRSPVSPGGKIQFEIELQRKDLRGKLEIQPSIVCAGECVTGDGRSLHPFSRVVLYPPLEVHVDQTVPLTNSGMSIKWVDFEEGDSSMYRWAEHAGVLSVELNNRCQVLQTVLDTRAKSNLKARARNSVMASIATDLMTQIAVKACTLPAEPESETRTTLLNALKKKGVSETDVNDCKTFAGISSVNAKLQNHYKVHQQASKLVMEMIGNSEVSE
jgi:hypothetical protein